MRKMRKITVRLEDEVARWARLEAARNGVSASRLLGDLLRQRMFETDAYQRAMRQALARKLFMKSEGQYLSREEAHDRFGRR